MTNAPSRSRAAGPIVGITTDIVGEKFQVGSAYAEMISRAGGVPVILPCAAAHLEAYLDLCHAFVLTGGDDPEMTQWGEPTHPKATPIDPQRQAFETALLSMLDARPRVPVLGICLGMQLMGLHAGGRLDQHLPDTLLTAADHWDRSEHPVEGVLGAGNVHTHHRQAITDPGSMQVVATAHDGVIEAIRAGDRPFYLGVQWHAERTEDERLGFGLIRELVHHAAASRDLETVTG